MPLPGALPLHSPPCPGSRAHAPSGQGWVAPTWQPARDSSSNREGLRKAPGQPRTVKIALKEAVGTGFQFPQFSSAPPLPPPFPSPPRPPSPGHLPTSSPVTPGWEPQAAAAAAALLPEEVLFCSHLSPRRRAERGAVPGQDLAAWSSCKSGCCCFSSRAGAQPPAGLRSGVSLVAASLRGPSPPSPFLCHLLHFPRPCLFSFAP